jgi:hypothetical protein
MSQSLAATLRIPEGYCVGFYNFSLIINCVAFKEKDWVGLLGSGDII